MFVPPKLKLDSLDGLALEQLVRVLACAGVLLTVRGRVAVCVRRSRTRDGRGTRRGQPARCSRPSLPSGAPCVCELGMGRKGGTEELAYLVGVLGEGLGQARRGASGVAANGGVQLRGVATGEQRGDDGKADSDWRG